MTDAVTFQPINSLQMESYIIKYCVKNNIPLNVTKIQKLMYCCYGTVLARFGVRLTDEQPAAWQYGPVFPAALKAIQYLGIEAFAKSPTAEAEALPDSVQHVIADTLNYFGKFLASQLSKWSHAADSPWSKASCGGLYLYLELSDDDIKHYFATKVFSPDYARAAYCI